MKFSTKSIHAGQDPDSATGAIITPIYQTATFIQEDIDKNKGFDYSRLANPTRMALEKCVACLEGAEYGLAFASGMAACAAAASLVKPGDHIVVGDDIYGGVYILFEQILKRYGISFTYVDTCSPDAVSSAITASTKLMWLETPTNPLLKLSDLKALAQIARKHNLISVVDNTFASPYFQRPLEHGIDMVVHSATKYLSGHSDVVSGIVVTSRTDLYEALKLQQAVVGGIAGPFDSWLVLRGIKTLALRMAQHERNAMQIAEHLSKHPAVEKAIYPGLPAHPHHKLAKRQMDGFGGMVSCVVKGGAPAARQFMKRTKLFALAKSLGGVESLICHPFTMIHGAVPADVKRARGLVDGLVRLSVGIEDIDDLIADLDQALSRTTSQDMSKSLP